MMRFRRRRLAPAPWVRGEWVAGEFELEHLDGVPWFEAPLPTWSHKCAPQTRGWIGLRRVHRCACGAIGEHRGEWVDKNSRRRLR